MALSLTRRDRLRRALLQGSLELSRERRRRLAGPPPRSDRGETLDEDTWWLLWLEQRFGPGIARGSVASARRRTRRSVAIVRGAVRSVARVEEVRLSGRPARLYNPGEPRPVLLYLHGGGWAVGDLDTHDALCRRLAADAGLLVVALDYRLAPEHPFPAAFDDTVAALRALPDAAAAWGGDPGRLLIGGDSAGGNLAAAACLEVRDAGPALIGQLLIYPATDLRRAHPSHRTLARGYLLEDDDISWYLTQYRADDPLDPRGSPLLAPSHARLPPAVVVTAGFDPLRDEGEAYACALADAGVAVTHLHEPGLVHGFTALDGVVPEADAAVARLVAATAALV